MKCKPDPIFERLVSMFSRRAFVSALAGAVAVLTGCERGAVVTPEKIVAAPSQESGGAANPSIVSIYTWDQYLNPTLLDEFKARTGIAVEVHTYESSDEMLEGLKSAAPFIAPELLADETINPRPEVLAKCQYFQLKDLESIRMVNTGWRRVMEAWSLQSGQASGKDLEPEEE